MSYEVVLLRLKDGARLVGDTEGNLRYIAPGEPYTESAPTDKFILVGTMTAGKVDYPCNRPGEPDERKIAEAQTRVVGPLTVRYAFAPYITAESSVDWAVYWLGDEMLQLRPKSLAGIDN